MKSIIIQQCGGIEVLQYKDVPKPEVEPGKILVKNSYSGINFIDIYFRTGLYKDTLPLSLGKEGSGRVEAVGEGVEGFKVGDRVAYLVNSGAYSEYTLASPAKATVLPEAVSEKIGAAALLQALTAYCMTTRSYAVKKGDWVLVHAGAGGTGRLLVQICLAFGAKVIGTTSTQEKAEIIKKLGAQHVLLYDEDIPKRVKEIADGEGVHVVFDGVGKSTFQTSLQSLRRLGSLISFGNASGKVDPIDILSLTPGNLSLLRPSMFNYITTKEEFDEASKGVFDLIANGSLDINVYKEYPLEEAGKAHTDLETRKATGKVLLRI
ncbi:hypothetical protein H4219_000383 [Mycoemilia scoparia]|uniref:Probable quinone oxidoreductase n=1 Tax=Mycoemilia scoparia TaxID=417184 RepID=A0A9W8A9M4_9FUNG|nr:hypothetical protein H4219_000383 [Mycoemilia scoparia]